jgi:hypothetical protein
VADCGADPEYRFDDLENLVRKARIDYGIIITFDTPAQPMFIPLRPEKRKQQHRLSKRQYRTRNKAPCLKCKAHC